MQISKNSKPRTPSETQAGEFICAAQQASFLALLNSRISLPAGEPHTSQRHPTPVSSREAITHPGELVPTRTLQTVEQLRMRLTNGALAGMLIEMHQQAGRLTLRLRLSDVRHADLSSGWLAELKRELATHFNPPIHLEFFDYDAPID